MPDLAPSAAPRELQWQLQQKCGSTLSYWWRLMDITMDSDGQLDIISPIYPQNVVMIGDDCWFMLFQLSRS